MRIAGSTTTRSRACLSLAALLVSGCARLYVSPLSPPPYRAEVRAPYDAAWGALVQALAKGNIPLRAIARDSGVIASDEFVTPIGLFADCGSLGDDRIEGEAVVSFTIFAEDHGSETRLLINSKMRTQAARRGSSGTLKPTPVYQCASTGRFEANLYDAVQESTKK
jgi:hypothetical protein